MLPLASCRILVHTSWDTNVSPGSPWDIVTLLCVCVCAWGGSCNAGGLCVRSYLCVWGRRSCNAGGLCVRSYLCVWGGSHAIQRVCVLGWGVILMCMRGVMQCRGSVCEGGGSYLCVWGRRSCNAGGLCVRVGGHTCVYEVGEDIIICSLEEDTHSE